ncbi:histidine-phosphotransfer domain, HPT domain-containing protein [Choiromyces venosus 120613-1]|uniref:Histidine-phosphotransfer domain, HPT domain-containing protein n=1 Tax=Choiromyces venosus 120613-1 TaxID=1336337 RepID=A0A3N4KAL8_9PEZI|nr:histidine-phosphotransfer domain, HPT domain-containing protein [Choiromyces venosus 120613-1]
MPSKDTDTTTTTKETATEERESYQPNYVLPIEKWDFIDYGTFEQILEMDDEDEERDFSRAIVHGFMEQAEQTFKEMRACLEKKDLTQLSSLGHFLKGSSATLGLTNVKDHCEKIQNFGLGRDETGTTNIEDPEVSLTGIRSALDEMTKEYERAKLHLTEYYEGPGNKQS